MPRHAKHFVIFFSALLIILGVSSFAIAQRRAAGQASVRLPSADKIIADYQRALGGKRRLTAVRDAVYEWDIKGGSSGVGGRGRLETKSPASTHWKFDFTAPADYAKLTSESAATPRSAWVLARSRQKEAEEGVPSPTATTQSVGATLSYSELTTLTGAEASHARLQAALFATRLVNYRKLNILARVAGVEQIAGRPAFVVELATRDGARVRLLFDQSSKLLRKVDGKSEDGAGAMLLDDYRPQGDLLEPHRIIFYAGGEEAMRVELRSVTRNTGVPDTAFDPPGENTINVAALLREVARNQQILDERVSEYTFTRKQIEREINDRGEVKKEKTLVHEIYPVRGGGRVLKLVSENGVPLMGERLAREERQVAEEIEKIERDNARDKERRERDKAKREEGAKRRASESGAGGDGDDDLGVAAFLRACEFVSPRRERFRERDAIVFDFRPRPGFRPSNRGESLVAKLTGIVWIDPVDKQVMRLEARLTDGFKIGGGLVASVRSGSAFVIEQTRLPDGVWLPRFSQINASAKVFLLAGFRLDATREYGDYKRFSTESKDYELSAPKEQ